MAQTEEMKRLLLNGKPVGYEWHTTINPKSDIQVVYHCPDLEFKDNLVDLLGYYDEELDKIIEYNSFEVGIKANDEWWFEGDIIEFWHNDYENYIGDYINVPQKCATGILQIDKYGWLIKQLTGADNAFYDYDSPREWSWEKLKRIGNIHEEGK